MVLIKRKCFQLGYNKRVQTNITKFSMHAMQKQIKKNKGSSFRHQLQYGFEHAN